MSGAARCDFGTERFLTLKGEAGTELFTIVSHNSQVELVSEY